MGGGELPKIPDWRIYTIGEHCPELQHTQRMLKSVGLSDPWLRNEVWRYDRRNPKIPPPNVRFMDAIGLKPLKLGIGLAIISASIKYYLNSGDSHHGHGHGQEHH